MKAPTAAIDYCEVRCAAGYVCVVDKGKESNRIPRSIVKRLSLDHGFQAPRPVAQIIYGAVLLAAVGWAVHRMWGTFEQDAVFWGATVFLGAFCILGTGIILNAFEWGWFLKLETKRGIEKLSFSLDAQPRGLREFIRRARRDLGIVIESVMVDEVDDDHGTWNLEDTPYRHAGVMFKETEEGGVVAWLDGSQVKVLNPVAAYVFSLLDGKHTVAAIARALVEEFEVDYPSALRDVLELLRVGDAEGMVTRMPPVPEPGGWIN